MSYGRDTSICWHWWWWWWWSSSHFSGTSNFSFVFGCCCCSDTSSIPPRWPVEHGRPATRTAKEHVKSLKVFGREKRLSQGKGQASEEEEPASAESFNLFVFFSCSCLQLRMLYARTTLFVVSLNCIVIILLSFLLILPYYDNYNNLLSDSFLI